MSRWKPPAAMLQDTASTARWLYGLKWSHTFLGIDRMTPEEDRLVFYACGIPEIAACAHDNPIIFLRNLARLGGLK